jgi:hydroxymethylpyrimidine/phosphomethylpyrimidine kinase
MEAVAREGSAAVGALGWSRGAIARALTIAGSDSGGGAGIQADLKTFAAFGVFGMSAVTAVTAQNTMGVSGVAVLAPDLVAAQIDAVRQDIGVDAVKTGMLANAAIIATVAAAVRRGGLGPLVVDPVMLSKHGEQLLASEASAALRDELLPLADVLTPNLPEAARLLGCAVSDLRGDSARRQAAESLRAMGPHHVVLKGGHASDADGDVPAESVDLWFDGAVHRELRARRVATVHTHGTGCTFSAAIAAGLARGLAVADALAAAKEFVTWAIAHAPGLGRGRGPLSHFRVMFEAAP